LCLFLYPLKYHSVKRSRFQLTLLIITLLCLVTLVAIQIVWMLREAKRQEAQFSRSVGLALKRIEDNLEKYSSCTEPIKCSSCMLLTNTLKQVTNLDSIIKNDLAYYGIDIDFNYSIVDVKHIAKEELPRSTYITSNLSNKLKQSGYELTINFPKKRDFIVAQIGFIFISSIVLVVLVTVSFLLIYWYYRREKALSGQIRDFINNMTHEFKTPLTNIAFANSMISKHEAVVSDPKLMQYCNIIRTEHCRLKDRVDELLKTSHGESPNRNAPELVDLSEVVDDVIESFKARIDDLDGCITLKRSDGNYLVLGQVDQLHIVFGNLIDNAMKYCATAPKIDISLSEANGKVVVEVADNGIGIPAEHQPRIFEKFYRVPKGDLHDIKGFGLGLFHVKTIVERMGGTIEVASTRGKGSRFTLRFTKPQQNGRG